jgi:hypothetical protein
VSDEQERARIVLESHGRAGGKMRAAIEQARRDTIEEAARWLWEQVVNYERLDEEAEELGTDVLALVADRMRAALLGKQAGEAPGCNPDCETHEFEVPAPAEGAGEVCNECEGACARMGMLCQARLLRGRTPGRSR